MEMEQIDDFKSQIMNGDFNTASKSISGSIIKDSEVLNEIEFLIQEQNFLETLSEKSQQLKAIPILQKELTPRT